MMLNDRPVALRLAHLHLRMGSLALARAELEVIDGSGALDAPAMVDLAEARWRTGDLARAGVAADRALDGGADDPLAFVIAAEAAAARGRHAEADDLAGRALENLGTTLDALFAGMPRSTVWPGDPEAAMAPVPVTDADTAETGPPAASGVDVAAAAEVSAAASA